MVASNHDYSEIVVANNNRLRGRLVLNQSEFNRACTDRGWITNRQRANALGVDHSVLSRLVRHECSPSLDVLDVLAHALAIPHGALIYRES